MKVKSIRSDKVYNKILNVDLDRKDDIYRYELMNELADKWACYNVPIKAKQKGGYDVIMANSMLGYIAPRDINESKSQEIKYLNNESVWNLCTESIEKSLEQFVNAGVELKVDEYKYTILLANAESIYAKLSGSCCGDGGIPGSIFLSLIPKEDTMNRIPSVLAHECNHNVRFQFIKWSNDITLEEMMINEALDVKGLEGITAYLYGDEIAEQQGYFPEGLPYCAGYACGYYMIKYYLNKTGKSIIEATLMPYEEIKRELSGFWDVD